VSKQAFELEFGISGVIFRVAGGEGLAVPGEGERMNREQDEELVFAQCGAQGPLVEFQAHSDRLASKALAKGTDPLGNGCGSVGQNPALSFVGVSGLEAEIMLGIGPVDADESGEWLVR
jgi:hypothetical protein